MFSHVLSVDVSCYVHVLCINLIILYHTQSISMHFAFLQLCFIMQPRSAGYLQDRRKWFAAATCEERSAGIATALAPKQLERLALQRSGSTKICAGFKYMIDQF